MENQTIKDWEGRVLAVIISRREVNVLQNFGTRQFLGMTRPLRYVKIVETFSNEIKVFGEMKQSSYTPQWLQFLATTYENCFTHQR